MHRLPHEPGEPTPEDLARQFNELMGTLSGVREMFIIKQHAQNILMSQTEDMFQRFETEQIEQILAGLSERMTIPWKPHAETIGDQASDVEASADTYIDPVGKSVVRYEATEAQGTEQIEIIITYRVDGGELVAQITTETEDSSDTLEGIHHPAFTPLELPGGERLNESSASGTEAVVMGMNQAKQFVGMMREIVTKLAQVYNQKGWEIMLDTDRTANDVESGDPRAVYKIERLAP